MFLKNLGTAIFSFIKGLFIFTCTILGLLILCGGLFAIAGSVENKTVGFVLFMMQILVWLVFIIGIFWPKNE